VQPVRKDLVVGSFGALRRAVLTAVSLILATSMSVTIATQLKLTFLMAAGDSPLLSVVANQKLKEFKEERMATKSTTTVQLVVGDRKGDDNDMIQLVRKDLVVGSFGALRRAVLTAVSLILATSMSVTIATQLKLMITRRITPLADGEV